ncbi:MAG: hypothetical protein F6K42_11520 [Leptolyngbya sp. SIO1D8]|nr:hypothetical protein [Leptolyngbya sp. SIO1D8]
MTRWESHYWTVLGSSAVAIGTQLAASTNALAHEGHPHRNEAESTSPSSTDEQSIPDAETAIESPGSTHDETVEMPSTEMPMEERQTPIEATSESPSSPAAVSQANVTEGFSIGLGESLLGLIIAGPFLLLTLKKRLQA